jgi:DNA primase
MMALPDRAREIRERLIDAAALCAALGLRTAPRASARACMICCPAHAENTPSCSVRVAKDGTLACRCHACGWSADALGLIALVEGLSDFAEVLRRGAELANAPALAESHTAERGPKDEREPVSDEDYAAIWPLVFDAISPMRCHAMHVAAYLLARGIFADAEAAGVRGLPRDGRALVGKLLSTFDRTKLVQAGVLRAEQDALDWPAHALCVPWRDRFGRIVSVQRRRLDDVRPKYLTPRGRAPRAPFGVEHLGPALDFLGPDAEVIICEGALDTLARRRIARERGERAAVIGIYSASSPCVGLPLDLVSGRQVVLALDDDEAGDRACAALASALQGVARNFIRARPVGAKDWGDALAGSAAQ